MVWRQLANHELAPNEHRGSLTLPPGRLRCGVRSLRDPTGGGARWPCVAWWASLGDRLGPPGARPRSAPDMLKKAETFVL